MRLDLVLIDDLAENVVGNKAYGSDPSGAEVRKGGIEMFAPLQRNRRRPQTRDEHCLRRYEQRGIIER